MGPHGAPWGPYRALPAGPEPAPDILNRFALGAGPLSTKSLSRAVGGGGSRRGGSTLDPPPRKVGCLPAASGAQGPGGPGGPRGAGWAQRGSGRARGGPRMGGPEGQQNRKFKSRPNDVSAHALCAEFGFGSNPAYQIALKPVTGYKNTDWSHFAPKSIFVSQSLP